MPTSAPSSQRSVRKWGAFALRSAVVFMICLFLCHIFFVFMIAFMIVCLFLYLHAASVRPSSAASVLSKGPTMPQAVRLVVRS